jgi:predicted O-linked N-acetylglucosamine transferase (SPINDLY family)
LKEAEQLYQAVLKRQPEHFETLHSLGLLRAQQGDLEAAVELISRALEREPGLAEAHFNLGVVLARLNRHAEAIARYDKATTINPGIPEVLNDRGISLSKLKRHDEAIESYDRAIAIRPDYADAFNNRGTALRALDRHEEAIASYDRALAIRPAFPEALNNRCNALQVLNRHAEAIESYDRAIALKPDYAEAFNNRGTALRALGRHEEALASYERALKLVPDYRYAFGAAMECRAYICDWQDRDVMAKRLVEEVKAGKPVSVPFPFLAISDDPADQLTCAETFVRDKFPRAALPLWKGERYRHDRIRVAYLSADFRDHAIAYLIAGLFELHDRSRFETTAISFGPDAPSAMRSRLVKSFDRFLDVRGQSDVEVARLLREAEIDIVIDLMGFTQNSRTGILAHRPAPIQVNYLGYPGTMGAQYIDYIIADPFVIPKDQRVHYSEKVVYLPNCYLVNDSQRRIAERTPARSEAGLPEHGFVFCCFNNSYKLMPRIFDVWMRLLQRVDGSVLWLRQGNPATDRNLRREARSRGVDPDRLVFAARVKSVEEHLGRHRLADLFLDTLPYNAHTTASDALWTGLPVVTCAATTFASRVAGSLLHAVGLPELVTDTLEDYEALALELASDPARLNKTKQGLARNRLTAPLFDTDRSRQHIEAAFMTMWEMHQRGESPSSFAVTPGYGHHASQPG